MIQYSQNILQEQKVCLQQAMTDERVKLFYVIVKEKKPGKKNQRSCFYIKKFLFSPNMRETLLGQNSASLEKTKASHCA